MLVELAKKYALKFKTDADVEAFTESSDEVVLPVLRGMVNVLRTIEANSDPTQYNINDFDPHKDSREESMLEDAKRDLADIKYTKLHDDAYLLWDYARERVCLANKVDYNSDHMFPQQTAQEIDRIIAIASPGWIEKDGDLIRSFKNKNEFDTTVKLLYLLGHSVEIFAPEEGRTINKKNMTIQVHSKVLQDAMKQHLHIGNATPPLP